MNNKSFLIIFLLFAVSALYANYDWTETGSLTNIRKAHNAVLLTDGRIMVKGGYPPAHNNYETFSPATGTFTAPALMPKSEPGGHNMSVLLYNGKVLCTISGDWYRYSPRTNTWDTLANYGWTDTHCYTLLYDGNVIGFYNDNGTILYNYISNTGAATSACGQDHRNAAEVLLPDGRVLVCGHGMSGAGETGVRCDRYDPTSQSWTRVANMNADRSKLQAILLPLENGQRRVLAFGATSTQSELYNWQTDSWVMTTGTGLNWPDRDVGTSALLPEGRVLTMGGEGPLVGDKCELYDPASQSWSITDTMKYKRQHNSAVILATGKVIAIGSFDDSIGGRIPEIYDNTNGYWDMRTPLQTGRCYAAVSMLPILHTTNCSTNVLISGGENGSGALSSCELYNYRENTVQYTGSLNTARTHHTANLLMPSTEQVLVAGGRNGGGALNTSELYNLTTGNWAYSGNLNAARYDHTATMLKDQRIIVTGGESSAGNYLSSCEIYNAGTWTNTATAMSTPRSKHSAIILLNGNIMVIGGETTGGNPTATCEIWNGTNWTAVPAASMGTARSLHTATLLQSGKVLVVGGMGAGGTALNTCEIYDPIANTWTAETPITTARYAHNTTLLYSGLVLVSGGTNGTNYYSSCEIFDPGVCNPVTGLHQWRAVPGSLANVKAYQASVLIPIDKPYILSIGGCNSMYLNQIERFDIGLGYNTNWQPTITNRSAVTTISDSMALTGTLFRGVSEADGGNHCHTVSNDHPIISLVKIGGGNWQGNGGGEVLTMPMSSSWDTTHTTVHPQISDFQGYYRIWAIVNGIPSKWYPPCPTGIEEDKNLNLKTQKLEIYPNPATIKTGVSFRLSKIEGKENINLQIFDLSGRLVRELSMNNISTTWDGKDSNGKGVRSGMYFYKLTSGTFTQKGKFIILR